VAPLVEVVVGFCIVVVLGVRGGLGFVYGGRWFVEIRRNGGGEVGNGGFKGEGKESAGTKMGV